MINRDSSKFLLSFAALILSVFTLMYVALNSGSSGSPTTAPISISPQSQLAQVSGAGSGLVGHWTFDEGSGTSAADSSGSGAQGTITGATWTTGKIGSALSFNGSGNYVGIGSPAALNLSGEASVFAWVKFNDVNDGNFGAVIFGQCTSGAFETLTMKVGATDGKITVAWGDANILTSTASFVPGTWYHIGFTRSGSAGSWTGTLYVNGSTDTTATGIATNPGAQSGASIGKCGDSAGQYLNGVIDDVNVYNRALSASDAQTLFNQGNVSGGGGNTPDTTAPVISGISSSGITSNGATISWTTDEQSTSQVLYGLTSTYTSQTGEDSNRVTSHSQALNSLQSNTVYHYAVVSKDAVPNRAQSTPDQTFTTASASQVTYAINASAGSNGSITPSGSVSINSGGSQTFTITPSSGYQVSSVTVDGSAVTSVPSAGGSYSFSNVTANRSISVSFSAVASQPSSVTVSTSGTGSGSVTCGGTSCPASVTNGTQLTFAAAAANSGSSFASWGGACVGVSGSTCTLTINANTTVSATFNTTQPPVSGSFPPSDRLPPGNAWANAGVPGGIPSANWPVCRTLSASGGDDTSAIQSAVVACANSGAGAVVYLNPGTYKFSRFSSHVSGLYNASNVVIRGAGPDQTTLKISPNYSYGGANITFGNDESWPEYPASKIFSISGATQGATSIQSSGASAAAVGDIMMINELNRTMSSNTQPAGNILVTGQGNGTDPSSDRDRSNTRNHQQMVRVTGTNGTTISFTPALYWDYTSSPQMALAPSTVRRVGVEDLKIDGSAQTGSGDANYAIIAFHFADQCWIKNVDVGYGHTLFFLRNTVNCEIRDSYFHDPIGGSFVNGSDNGYGQVQLASQTLIENNIFMKMLAPIVYAGAEGNVDAYNYIARQTSSLANMITGSIDTNHGAFGMFNLSEGNTAPVYNPDHYYGSSSHGMVFRNYFPGSDQGVTEPITCFLRTISIDEQQLYYSVVGNVLGTPSVISTTVNSCGSNLPSGPSSWKYEPPSNFDYTTPVIYRLGWHNMGNNGGSGDPQVQQTTLRGGNYDYSTRSIVWNNNAPSSASTYLAPQTLPPSMYRSSKPSWFGSTPWPAIGPDVTGGSDQSGHVYDIPAKRCYVSQNIGGGGKFNGAACYGTSGPVVPSTLTVTKSGAGASASTVTSSPAGISCGATCSASFNGGTTVTLTAAPASGYSTSWSGCSSQSGNTCTVFLNSNTTVTATFNIFVADTTPPSVPTGLSATAASASQINLTWTASTDNAGGSGVAGYRIYRCSGAGCTLAAVATSTAATYADSGLSGTTAYTYKVSAFDAATPINFSAQSASAGATTFSGPYVITVTKVGSGVITSNPAGIDCAGTNTCTQSIAAGSSVTVTAAPLSGSAFLGWTGSCTVTTPACTVSAAATMTATFGVSDTASPTVSITSPAAGASVSGAAVSLAANASDNVGVLGVQFKLDGANLGTELSTAPYSGTWNTSSVANGSHTLTAVARDAAGNAATSNPISVTVSNLLSDTTPPPAPLSLRAAVVSQSQINLTWNASVDPTVSGQSTSGTAGYYIYRNGGTTAIATVTGTAYSDTGLASNTSYSYSVAAFDGAGNKGPTSIVSAVTQPATYAFRVTIAGTGSGGVTAACNGATCVSPVTQGTQVVFTETPAKGSVFSSWGSACAGVTGTTCTLTINASTNVSASFASISYLAPLVTLTSPIGGTFKLGSTLSLAATASDPNGGTITKVEFYADSTLLSTDTTAPYAYPWTPSAASTYSVYAKAYASEGTTGQSASVSAAVKARGGKPSKIVSLSATAGSVILAWALPDDPYLASVAIYRRTDSFPTTTDAAYLLTQTSAASYRDADVSPGTTYYYSIFSVDDQGAYSDPAQISFTVAAATPAPGPGSSPGPAPAPGNAPGGPTGTFTPTVPQHPVTTPGVNCPTGLICRPVATTTLEVLPSSYLGLTIGSRGSQVNALQSFLIRYGYLAGQYNTGYYGQLTQGAVNRYLTDHAAGAPASIPQAGLSGSFSRSLMVGSSGNDVRNLQIFLNTHGFPVTASGNGSVGHETTYFGPATAAALIKFQNVHASEILAPVGLTQGTGYFGTGTMKAINRLLGQ